MQQCTYVAVVQWRRNHGGSGGWRPPLYSDESFSYTVLSKHIRTSGLSKSVFILTRSVYRGTQTAQSNDGHASYFTKPTRFRLLKFGNSSPPRASCSVPTRPAPFLYRPFYQNIFLGHCSYITTAEIAEIDRALTFCSYI